MNIKIYMNKMTKNIMDNNDKTIANFGDARKKVGRKEGKTKPKELISSINGFDGVFKPIKGYEGLYYITEDGRVYSGIQNKWLKSSIITGYPTVKLQGKRKLIHRLVAESFIPNPDNLPQVNHKDENRENCHVDNLEWCTPKYNINYGSHNDKANKSRILTYVANEFGLNDNQKQMLKDYLQQLLKE